MPKRATEKQLDDLTEGAATAIQMKLAVAQFKRLLWDDATPAARAELDLAIAAVGFVGEIATALAQGFVDAKAGKMPSVTIDKGQRRLHQAACVFAKDGTFKSRAKTAKKSKEKR